MKKLFSFVLVLSLSLSLFAQIDMQAHVASDEGRAAYRSYVNYQYNYYCGDYDYTQLILLSGDSLFGALSEMIAKTTFITQNKYDYDALRYEYLDVDTDLNKEGYIIGFYDGRSMNGTWDGGKTYNREHTWPQSKGANKKIPMGYDMQSVRPAHKSINSSRGNKPFGEGAAYYDPSKVKINNEFYDSINLGTYRGDCAREILYSYIAYGQQGGFRSRLYNGKAQLLSTLGPEGVFESLGVMLKWHLQDPPSLTEMVRNDGSEDYQGNRNPLIDFPELALLMLKDQLTTYPITTNYKLSPSHQLTTEHGFICYLTDNKGNHPELVEVTGATAQYDAKLGRLIISQVTEKVHIEASEPYTSVNDVKADKIDCYIQNKTLYINNLQEASIRLYDTQGRLILQADNVSDNLSMALTKGVYILQVNDTRKKVII